MTTQEAIEYFSNMLLSLSFEDPMLQYDYDRAMELAIKALKKQVPRNLILTGDDIWRYKCPSCDTRFVSDTQEYPCCPNCGQSIDWGDVEE